MMKGWLEKLLKKLFGNNLDGMGVEMGTGMKMEMEMELMGKF